MNTDNLVLKHQGISSHNAEKAPMRFQLLMVMISDVTVVAHMLSIRTSNFDNLLSNNQHCPLYFENGLKVETYSAHLLIISKSGLLLLWILW